MECMRRAEVVQLKPPATTNSAPRQQRRLLLRCYSTLLWGLVTKSIITNQATSVNIPSTIQAREYVAAELNVVRQQRCWTEPVKKLRFINYFSILVKIPASDEFCTMNVYRKMWRCFKKTNSVIGNFPKWLLTPSMLFSDAPSTGISRKHMISI